MIRNYLLLCLSGISVCFVADSVAHVALINADKAGVDEFPYQISLQYRGRHHCGGGILNNLFVITAAHCVIKHEIRMGHRRVVVVAGTNDLRRTGNSVVIVEIHKIFIPVTYDPADPAGFADIAVLKLKKPLELSKHIRKLQLPKLKDETYFGKTAEIAGFGWQWVQMKDGKPHGGRNDSQLRFAKVDILEYFKVGQLKVKVPDNQIHAKVKQDDRFKPRSVCLGDSGSPLVHEDTVIGVVSKAAPKCFEINTGAIYTSVAFYLEFVKNAMKDKHHRDMRAYIL